MKVPLEANRNGSGQILSTLFRMYPVMTETCEGEWHCVKSVRVRSYSGPTYKVGFWYFRSWYIRDMVSDKTYQNFRDKRLVRPGCKYPIWQRFQPISYKTKFSQRDNAYLVDFKYNITYQNIRGKTKVRSIFKP